VKRLPEALLGLLLLVLGALGQRHRARAARWRARLRLRLKWMLVGVLLFAVTAGAVGALVAALGLPSIKASSGHWAVTAWFLDFAKQRSVALHSMNLAPPQPLDDSRLVLIGAGHYETGCRFCHAAPGQPLPPVPHQMTPHPPRLDTVAREFDDAELFYIVFNGLKLTGMPAWPSPQREDEAWAMVAFLRKLPELDAAGYQQLVFGPALAREDAAPEVVVRTCARCHGVDGLGRGGAFPLLAGQRPEYLRRSLEAFATGQRHSGIMRPVAAALDAAAVEQVVAWYAGLRPERAAGGAEAGPDGARIALQGIPHRRIPACAECHGPGRPPRHPAYPRLSGQHAPYLEQQLRLFGADRRGGTDFLPVMKAVLIHRLEPQEISALAAFYASLPPGEPP
jgi:cytochrome c553